MFRNRRTSQKPSDELYKDFKASFGSHLNHGVAGASASEAESTTLVDALDISLHPQHSHSPSHDIKDGESTPRAPAEPWTFGTSGLTPSIMDPNQPGFGSFTNYPHLYFPPTPGGNTLFSHQAGDLHTPGPGIGLSTPLSLPTSDGALHGHATGAFHGFQNHLSQHHVQHQPYQNVNPFHVHHQPTSYAPHQFTHQHSFGHLDGQLGDSPVDDMGIDVNMHAPQQHSPHMLFHSQSLQNVMKPSPHAHPSGEKFRYHVTMNAPTAMIKHADEIPITYLNKGQTYTLNVFDTLSRGHTAPYRYRTYVRVSFEEEQQREKPAACWQLWKEGRGTNEAHQRGGRLQAVEYVESNSTDDPSKARIELENASFDGFCVQWTPAPGTTDCPIIVRFNFLSTDFSHSKGVKGIPVRLCAKTEAIGEMPNAPSAGPEISYCKVKLFRDHGAERKLSNDLAHVRKTIEKLNAQIAQIESGMKDSGKRKRSGSMAKLTGLDHRPGKVPKHRRTWSMSSVTSNSGRGSAEDELHQKVMTLNDMFSSTRPASVLHLRGAEEDDPDLHPVKLSGELQTLDRNDSTDTAWEERQSSQAGAESSMTSRSPSANSQSGSRNELKIQQPTPIPGASRMNSSDWMNQSQTATMDIQPSTPTPTQQLQKPPDKQPIKVQTLSPSRGTTAGWIETLDVDPSYQPPTERPVKPIACFYVQPRVAGRSSIDNFYRAIYLFRRTLKDFQDAAASKCNIDPADVVRTVRISRDGLQILFDDDCIRELPEGQDMTAEFCESTADEAAPKPSREWDAGSTDVQCDGDLVSTENVPSTGYELRLLF